MEKFAGLELCRFLCALSVVVWHYQKFFVKGIWDDSILYSQRVIFPFYHILAPFYQNGFYAVQMFWALSGFIFFWKYSNAICERSITANKFFVLRFSRLYPLHFVTLIAVALLQYIYVFGHKTPLYYAHNDIVSFILQLGLASNWLDFQPRTFNGPIWSVSTEILVYMLFFAMLRISKPSLTLCAAIVVMSKIVMHYQYSLVLLCIHFFFAGGLTQQLIQHVGAKGRKVAFWGSGGVVTFAIAALHYGPPITVTYILILSIGVLLFFSLIEDVNGLDVSKWTWLGDLTYSSYLLHFPIQLAGCLTVDAIGVGRDIFLSPFVLSLFLVATFGSAWIVNRHFEMPMQNAIRALWISRRTQPVLP